MTEKEKTELENGIHEIVKWFSGDHMDKVPDIDRFNICLQKAEAVIAATPATETPRKIPQIKKFVNDFAKRHLEPPRYVICNRKTFRELEIEAGIGYIRGNPCATVYGNVIVVPEDCEVIIGNGYLEKYSFEGAKK